MYEPKYKLNKKDAARWHELLCRDCAQYPKVAGGVVVPNPKYPPLTKKEQIEFEQLQRKRSKKVCSHPKVKASLECQRRHNRKLQRLLKKLKTLVPQLNETKCPS